MKKVLFVTPFNPEKRDSGENIYSMDIIESLLSGGDIKLHVVTYIEEAKESKADYSVLKTMVDEITYVPFKYKNILRIGLSVYPAMIANRKTNEMITTVQTLLRKTHYDAIIVNHPRLEYLIEYIRDFRGKKIFISHNVEHNVCQSTYKYAKNIGVKMAYYLDYLKTKYWEKRYLSQYDAVSAICDVDVANFKAYLSKEDVFLVTPLVEHHEIAGDWQPTNAKKMIVCGSFMWTPKTLNLRKLLHTSTLKDLQEENIELMIVGRAPKTEVKEANEIPNVHATGEVESVAPYYKQACVSIVPELAGGGFKLKIAEAVKYDLPIVAIKGSVTDLQMKPGEHYVEVDTFEELITEGIRLVHNPEKRISLVRNANRLFKGRYNPAFNYSQLLKHIIQ